MRRTIENIVIGILIVSLLLAVLGVILTNEALTKAAFVVLMIVALAYTVLQVLDYFVRPGRSILKQMNRCMENSAKQVTRKRLFR